ncbi:MAG TPA: pilus assembly protein TadG-related protein [Caulobacteraceae bacterium]|jgi:hypothetical protein
MIRRLQRLAHDERGNVFVMVALALPMLALMVAGGVEFTYLRVDRQRLQEAADASALYAAGQLTLASHQGLEDRANAYALEQSRKVADHSDVSANSEILYGGRALKVTLQSRRGSFFGDLLPPGGFRTIVHATAQPMMLHPICVLGLLPSGEPVSIEGKSTVDAPGCAVQSNLNLEVQSDARLTAAKVEASGTRKGSGLIKPAIQTGAKAMRDPFASRMVPVPANCMTAAKLAIKVDKLKVQTLAAGVHRGGVEVSNLGVLTLDKGEHYFCDGDFVVKDNATVTGDGVGLFFHKTARLKIDNSATADLLGLKQGAWAGFLIAAARDNTATFEVKSVKARRLEGVVYLPKAKLSVDTTAPGLLDIVGNVSQRAKWTVAIVNEMVVKGAPHLYINDDYAGSSVPVPPAVTNNALRLVE